MLTARYWGGLRGTVALGESVAAVVARIVGISAFATAAQAQTAPAILDPDLVSQYTRTEYQIATAVTDVYNYVSNSTICPYYYSCPSGIWNLVNNDFRSLNESAEEILGQDGGENGYHVSLDGLNDAFRWLAPEELFSLAPIATGFVNGQLGALNSRLNAGRSLSRTQLFAKNVVGRALRYGYASNAGVPAGSAGADFSRLNVFLDAAVNFGNHEDTAGSFGSGSAGTEDAFDFEGKELSLGVDWRFSDNLVAGALLGYTGRKVDFDAGKSAANGNIDASGASLIAFAQWDDRRWYGNLALGYQKLDYDVYRRIVPNPDAFSSPNAAATGSPDGSGLLGSLNLGLPFQWGSWGVDVYLSAALQKQSVDAFSEELVDDAAPFTTGFLFNVGKQDVKSFDTAVGLKLQYVAKPSFGVVVPFLRAEFHRELEHSPRQQQLQFQGLEEVTFDSDAEYQAALDAFSFTMQSDRPDKAWVSAAIGASAVIRGSTRVDTAGRGGGGLQAYLQYSTVFGLAHYHSGAINAGLRYEF